ncbi:hypothetical protein BHE90_015697 [Fusarium euwallaceae]|uniref:Uncharacterized protein n=2 Tax=Fusarium solani species complex TaxID=232080 RepID=A0A430L2G5_9HYPO|nr:hypothetical protein CEP51_013749 [Fusarium floridanum]RTE69917.1 hypothetical protein BHE90_015697 [Fusarium euwallaceae]
MRSNQQCDTQSPETPAPRHPTPWRQRAAKLHERIYDVTLPDVVETSGSHLVPAPPTPTNVRPHDALFIKQLHRALELVVFAHDLRCSMYGRDIAEDTHPGHTPAGLREKLRREAEWAIDPSSESETSSTPAEDSTPQSHGDRSLDPASPLLEDDLPDKTETLSNRNRRRDEAEGEGEDEDEPEVAKRRRF